MYSLLGRHVLRINILDGRNQLLSMSGEFELAKSKFSHHGL
jgi:hypothetical protein